MTGDNTLKLVDETLRDGTQSLWGMMMSYHMIEPVIGEIGEIGFDTVMPPVHGAYPTIWARFFKEDPREVLSMVRNKLTNTKSNVRIIGVGTATNLSKPFENKTVAKMCYQYLKEAVPQINEFALITCTQDELRRIYPVIFPMFRSLGIEPIPYLAIGHSSRFTEEYYASQTKEIVEKYKPKSICIKDVNGLLTPERLRKILAAIQEVADGTPFEFHGHGMNGLHSYNAVVAMQMGVRKISTCIPPLAYDSSHPSVFNVISNAEEMGISPDMDVDVEKMKEVSDRLTKIGEAYGHPVDNHLLPFDLTDYNHQIPGGVISNTKTQLAQLGLSDMIEDVLEEIPRILEELGNPQMVTPFSQFIVTQAVLNVHAGRWEQCLDSIIEFAAGMFGYEEAGVPYMDQNLKDKLFSLPQAKAIIERADNYDHYINEDLSEAECKKRAGLSPNDSIERYALKVCMEGEDELANVTQGGPDFYKKYL